MYHFKEVQLKNAAVERKVLVIEFAEPRLAIVAEFLMSDASLLGFHVLEEIDRVLAGEVESITTSGNRCSLVINEKTTVIEDLLEGMFDDFETFETAELSTRELRELIIIWREKSSAFKS